LELNVSESLESFSPEVEQCTYRVAQEAVENVVKHAQASSMRVSLLCDDGLLTLEVEDDGCGFSVERLEAGPMRFEDRHPDQVEEGTNAGADASQNAFQDAFQAVKFGIKGMQERAELIGAALEVKSAKGQGTVIRLQSGRSTREERPSSGQTS
jgi:two-component system sensor histidine kinase DegS